MAGKTKGKKSVSVNKSQSEKQDYNRFIVKSSVSPEATISTYSKMLHGSNEFLHEDNNISPSEKPVPTPLRISIGDWLKEHSVEILIVVIILGVMGWLCLTVIDLSMDSREILTKIENIQKDIDSLEEGSVSREMLELELNALQSEFEKMSFFNLDEVTDRIAILEKQLELLTSRKSME